MSQITLHGNEISSVFELLGDNENDITYSTGWVLSKCNKLLELLLEKIIGKKIDCEKSIIRLQEYKDEDKGYTDIEIFIESELFFIIEAKRGWELPTKKQLMRYISRFEKYSSLKNRLIVISECKKTYAENELARYRLKVPWSFVSWQTILSLIKNVYKEVGYYEKRLLDDLQEYLKGVITMRDIKSNMVYCVSLGSGNREGSSISWIDIVEKKNKYFYPVGKGWPSDPPNYLAFRYKGKLQAIRHVESYEIVEHLHDSIPEIKLDPEDKSCYVMKLGPSFKPAKEVRNGKIHSKVRLWCMLDTLLICDTIKEASDLTHKREKVI
jgi:hypothetical protein